MAFCKHEAESTCEHADTCRQNGTYFLVSHMYLKHDMRPVFQCHRDAEEFMNEQNLSERDNHSIVTIIIAWPGQRVIARIEKAMIE